MAINSAFTPFDFAAPIGTPRLTLRAMTIDDVDDVHAYHSNPEVCRYQSFEPRSREVVAENVAEWAVATTLAADGDYIQAAVELATDAGARVIADLYFTVTSSADLTGELGWSMHPDFHGRGYATEAANALLGVAFGHMGLHRVVAELDPGNAASVALCRRLGMRQEAHLVENVVFKGSWADTLIYGILDREWAARAAH